LPDRRNIIECVHLPMSSGNSSNAMVYGGRGTKAVETAFGAIVRICTGLKDGVNESGSGSLSPPGATCA
jgi:hypothetical protein